MSGSTIDQRLRSVASSLAKEGMALMDWVAVVGGAREEETTVGISYSHQSRKLAFEGAREEE